MVIGGGDGVVGLGFGEWEWKYEMAPRRKKGPGGEGGGASLMKGVGGVHFSFPSCGRRLE